MIDTIPKKTHRWFHDYYQNYNYFDPSDVAVNMYRVIAEDVTFLPPVSSSRPLMLLRSDVRYALARIEMFVRAIGRISGPGFARNTDATGREFCSATVLAKGYYRPFFAFTWYRPNHLRCSEMVEAFFAFVAERNLDSLEFQSPETRIHDALQPMGDSCRSGLRSTDTYADLFNDAIRFIRSRLDNPKYAKRSKIRGLLALRNVRRCRLHVDRLLETHGMLRCFRFELGYRPEVAHQVTLEDAHAHLRRFFSADHAHPHYATQVGGIWRLDLADMRGLFFQVVLFFKGTFADDTVLMAREIEAHWREAITGGLGAAQDCSQIHSEFKNDGIGLIVPSDRLAGSLERLFHSLCKRDQYLTLKEGQTFGIAEMPEPMSACDRDLSDGIWG